MTNYFADIPAVSYAPDAQGLAFRHYTPDEMLGGKPKPEHLCFAVCY